MLRVLALHCIALHRITLLAMMRTFRAVLSLVVIISIFAATSEDCERWSKEGECAKNPRYLWANCLHSCMTHAKDDHQLCPKWAGEGECAKNPTYVQVHCPESCGYSVAWNPYTRKALNIEMKVYGTADYHHSQLTPCLANNEVYRVASTLRNRVKNILNNASYIGLSKSAPTEFLLAYGIAEACLYSLRLYEVTANHATSQQQRGASPSRVFDIAHGIRFIEDNLSYDADRMVRGLKQFEHLLDMADEQVRGLSMSGETCLIDNLRITQVSARYAGALHPDEVSSSIEVDAGGDMLVLDAHTTGHTVLSNGLHMPFLGLGTWQLSGDDCERTVYNAIKIGYRHIDTAQAYGNEADVGRAIRRVIDEGVVTRKDLFIATKLSFENDSGSRLPSLLQVQLERLQVEYIDLYYLHSPLRSEALTKETWKALESLYADGIVRAVGVSNFNSHELRELLRTVDPPSSSAEGGVTHLRPMVLQNKFDVYHHGRQLDNVGDDVLATCRDLGVHVIGYSPFSSFPFAMLPLHDPIVNMISATLGNKEVGVTAARVLMEWSLRQGVSVIPRSHSVDHLQVNYDAAVGTVTEKLRILSHADMQLLSSIANLVSSPFVKALGKEV